VPAVCSSIDGGRGREGGAFIDAYGRHGMSPVRGSYGSQPPASRVGQQSPPASAGVCVPQHACKLNAPMSHGKSNKRKARNPRHSSPYDTTGCPMPCHVSSVMPLPPWQWASFALQNFRKATRGSHSTTCLAGTEQSASAPSHQEGTAAGFSTTPGARKFAWPAAGCQSCPRPLVTPSAAVAIQFPATM